MSILTKKLRNKFDKRRAANLGNWWGRLSTQHSICFKAEEALSPASLPPRDILFRSITHPQPVSQRTNSLGTTNGRVLQVDFFLVVGRYNFETF